jgi:hypothetical protein
MTANYPMGTRSVQQTTPDRVSTTTNRKGASSGNSPPNIAEQGSLRYVLPKDLPNAIKQLTDNELDALSAAVSVEQQRRGRNSPQNENAHQGKARDGSTPVSEGSIPLSVGKINAVRAAFKAGLTPSQIARQFRISQADVRKALASGSVK